MRDGRILIAEDDELFCKGLTELITIGGNEVVIASGSEFEAIRSIRERVELLGFLALDLALIDRNIIGGSGERVAHELRASGMDPLSMFNISGDSDIPGIPFRIGKNMIEILKVIDGYAKEDDTPEDVVLRARS